MNVRVDDDDVKAGVLSLVIVVVEILHELMSLQAVRRMEGGTISGAQCERLGRALMEMERVIDALKTEQGIHQSVRDMRGGLDRLLDGLLGSADIEEGSVDRDSACVS